MRALATATLLVLTGVAIASTAWSQRNLDFRVHQYHHGDITIPRAQADEPLAERLSTAKAASYLDAGAKAWIEEEGCVSCHTTGWYGILRPQLSGALGKPDSSFRDFLKTVLKQTFAEDRRKTSRGTGPAQLVYLTAALASWDAHVTKQLSPETEQALDLMFSLQRENGSWFSVETWPPFESDAYQLATVAAMAAGMAPGWIDKQKADGLAPVSRMKEYLRGAHPPHSYARVALLWAARYVPGLLDDEEKKAIVELILAKQRPDGGWSIRSFAEPEQWGVGNRAERLRAETDYENPPSDGHQTGLAIVVLSAAGVPSSDPAIERGVQWLQSNQRESGRWWTKSLNTDKFNFISYTGTLYPLTALTLTDSR
ncbi:MAG: hypothetical protein O2968_14060 [Acidobacteria bacterium]|nr:hypothetical protein [Acidobacteriota bacterium]